MVQGLYGRREQWGVPAQLPAFIRRLRCCACVTIITILTIATRASEGYTPIFEKLLDGIDVRLNCDYFDHRDELRAQCRKVVSYRPIDRYFDYCYGPLQFRSPALSLKCWIWKIIRAMRVVNYTDRETPYTRVIEHKHF